MVTPFGPYEPLVLPSVAADDGGVATFDERVDVMGSNFARGRPRLLNDTTFAELGAARAAEIGFSTVKVRGRAPIEILLSRPDWLGSATYQRQNVSLPDDARGAGPSIMIWTAYAVFFHLPATIPRFEETIFFGDSGVGKNPGVINRIDAVQAARDDIATEVIIISV
jgi:hypothetical protein